MKNCPIFLKCISFFCFLFISFSFQIKAQTFSSSTLLSPDGTAGMIGYFDWGDYDNDGDLDILCSGEYRPYMTVLYYSGIYRNDGSNTFTKTTSFSIADTKDVAWVDFDQDGDLDAMAGDTLYQNEGYDVFSAYYAFNSLSYLNSIDWGDYDNDGDLDLIYMGSTSQYSGENTYIYENNGDGTFTELTHSIQKCNNGEVEWGDYDNDGDLDILIAGKFSNTVYLYIYKNIDGTFTSVYSGTSSGDISVAWGDYDSDGDLDAYVYPPGTILKNNGSDTFVETTLGINGTADCKAAEFGDYNNDGELDLLLSIGDVSFFKNVSGTFSLDFEVSYFGSECYDAAFADSDNDGDLDVVESHFRSIATPDYRSYVHFNDVTIANAAPSVPSSLATSVDDHTVSFSWNQSTDDHTPTNAISYNIYLGTSSGDIDVIAPSANVLTGFRQIVGVGNSFFTEEHTFELPFGVYYWSVQSIDYAYKPSAFAAEQTLEVAPSATFSMSSSTCGTNAVTINYTGNASGAATFSWNFGGGSIVSGSGKGPYQVQWATSGTKTVTLSVTENGATSAVNNKTIVVKALSTAASSISADYSTICEGSSSSLSVSGGSLGSLASWVWYAGSVGGSSIGTGSEIIVSPTENTTYYVRAEGDCNETAPVSKTITVNHVSITASSILASKSTICSGESVDLSVVGGSLGTGAKWEWYAGNCGSGSIGEGTSITVSPTTTTTYYVRAVGAACGSPTACVYTTITVRQASSNPTDITFTSSSVCSGEQTTLSVTGTLGTDNSKWMWYVGGCGTSASIGNGISIDVTPSVQTTYYVRAEGECDTTNCLSQTILLKTSPSIDSDPTDKSICKQDNTNFQITASGNGISYQWQEYDEEWTNISNGTFAGVTYSGSLSDIFNIENIDSIMNGFRYRCVVTGDCSPSVTSNGAELIVKPEVTIDQQPVDQNVDAGNLAEFTIIVNGVNVTYQWQVDMNDGFGFQNLLDTGTYSGSYADVLSISATTKAMSGYNFRCTVDGDCSNAFNSDEALLYIPTEPTIGNQPINDNVCENDDAQFSITAAGDIAGYQWQENTGNGWIDISGTGYVGYNTRNLTVENITSVMNGYAYRCIAQGSPNAVSDSAIIIVNYSPEITVEPQNKATCNGDNASFSLTGTGGNLSYQWYRNEGSIWEAHAGAINDELELTGVTGTMNGWLFKCVVSGCNPYDTSQVVALSVNNPHSISNQPKNATACEGSDTSFSVVSGGTVSAYQWQYYNGSSWENISDNSNYSGTNSSKMTLKAVNLALSGNKYRCILSGPCIPDLTTTEVTLSVISPFEITQQPTNQATCNGQNASFGLAALGASSYQWHKSIDNGVSYSAMSGQNSSVLELTSMVLSNDGNLFYCSVSGQCSADRNSDTVTLYVNETPVIFTHPLSNNLCIGSKVVFSVASSGYLLDYQWQKNGVNIAGADSNVYVISSIAAGDAGNYKCVISNSCTQTQSNEATLGTLPLPPKVYLGNDTSICDLETVELDPGYGTAFLYEWSNYSTNPSIIVEKTGNYFVKLTNSNTCFQYSDTISIKVAVPYTTQKIGLVTVDPDTWKNMIVWEKAYDEGILAYRIYRGPVSNATAIATINFGDENRYIDLTSNPRQQSYRYSITSIDTCGNESEINHSHSTIHLSANLDVSQEFVNLSWNPYEGFDYDTFYIYKGGDSLNLELVGVKLYDEGLFSYSYQDVLEYTRIYYQVSVIAPSTILLDGRKANNGPFSRSISNLEDNRIQSTSIFNVSYQNIEVYPNPMTNEAIVSFNNPGNDLYSLCVYSISGQKVLTKDNITSSSVSIKRDNLRNGIYIIELRGNNIYKGKLIVE